MTSSGFMFGHWHMGLFCVCTKDILKFSIFFYHVVQVNWIIQCRSIFHFEIWEISFLPRFVFCLGNFLSHVWIFINFAFKLAEVDMIIFVLNIIYKWYIHFISIKIHSGENRNIYCLSPQSRLKHFCYNS
jgi:hypothetical protein